MPRLFDFMLFSTKTQQNKLANMSQHRLSDSLSYITKFCRQCEKNTLRKIFSLKLYENRKMFWQIFIFVVSLQANLKQNLQAS